MHFYNFLDKILIYHVFLTLTNAKYQLSKTVVFFGISSIYFQLISHMAYNS